MVHSSRGARDFFLLPSDQTGAGAMQSLIEWVLGTLSSCVKWPESEAA